MTQAIPQGSVVYIRYKDHVLFRNTAKHLKDAAERKTVGWLTQENKNSYASNTTENYLFELKEWATTHDK